MEILEKNLLKAKTLCSGLGMFYHDFASIYTFTTENIADYLKYFDLENKSLLTVGSSGDQILNAYYCGTKDLTLFDVNEYAKYFVYLKIAAIMTLDYQDFINFFFKFEVDPISINDKMFSKAIFNKIKQVLHFLDYDSYYFFEQLFNTYQSKDIRHNLFNDCEYRGKVIKGFNLYLKDEENYNKLKAIINGISFKYINGDIYKDDIVGKYDNIFLSNLITYEKLNKFRLLLDELISNNLNDNGSLLFAYLWNIYYNSDDPGSHWKDVYKMPITREKFKEYISEYHQIESSSDILNGENNKEDLVLIYRKNNK